MRSGRVIRNLALIGFMGTGKTTIGRLVASQLHFQFLDTDQLIEAQAGLSVSEIFARHGEAVFRQIERRVVAELSQRRDIVAATGGGLGADPENLASLKTHALVICLWATAEAIWERTQHQTHRPLLQVADPLEQIRHLLTVREPVYRQADVLINTAHRQSREVVQQVIYHFCLARDASARP